MADFAAVTPTGRESDTPSFCVVYFATVTPNGSEARRFGICVADFAAVLLKGLGPAPSPILALSRRQCSGETQSSGSFGFLRQFDASGCIGTRSLLENQPPLSWDLVLLTV